MHSEQQVAVSCGFPDTLERERLALLLAGFEASVQQPVPGEHYLYIPADQEARYLTYRGIPPWHRIPFE